MEKIKSFKELRMWQKGIEIVKDIYMLTSKFPKEEIYGLTAQMRRSAISIPSNIAEGFERGSTAELLAFLYISRGSCGETRSMLLFTERFPEATHLKSEISNLKSLAESCSRQIRGWTNDLQNSDIKGQRHLNDQVRIVYQGNKRREAFEKQLEETMRKARPQDYPEEEK